MSLCRAGLGNEAGLMKAAGGSLFSGLWPRSANPKGFHVAQHPAVHPRESIWDEPEVCPQHRAWGRAQGQRGTLRSVSHLQQRSCPWLGPFLTDRDPAARNLPCPCVCHPLAGSLQTWDLGVPDSPVNTYLLPPDLWEI